MTTVANGIDEVSALAGKDLGATGWLEVTQQRVDTFADATDDHQWNKVRFPAPVPVGSRIRMLGTVVSVDPVQGGVQAIFDFTVEAEGVTKPVCVARSIQRFYA